MSAGKKVERLVHLDSLRGFALFGILAVNIWYFADPYYVYNVSNPFFMGFFDQLTRFMMSLLFETKFYLLFSFMFGYSFTLQKESASRRQSNFSLQMLRRFTFMLFIGILHGILVYNGDILTIYACLGFVLILLMKLTDRQALSLAVALLVLTGCFWILMGVLQHLSGDKYTVDIFYIISRYEANTTSAISTLLYTKNSYPNTLLSLWILQAPATLSLFLIGMVAGRRKQLVLSYASKYLNFKTAFLSGTIGFIGSLFYAYAINYHANSALEAYAYGIGTITAPFLAFFYIILFLAFYRTDKGQKTLDLIAPMGKMSMSNYILQSILLSLIFTGYGLKLMDKLSSGYVILTVIGVYVFQVIFSRYWLNRHIYGPFEWFLRTATLLKRVKWKL